jgi:hypothetical protein
MVISSKEKLKFNGTKKNEEVYGHPFSFFFAS